MERKIILKAENIHKSYGDLEVLKGVSLEVHQGEFISIIGASGAGKSTLLQILGTLSEADSGEVEIDGVKALQLNDKDVSKFRNTKIGFVFQAHHLLNEFTALENVSIPGYISGRDKSEVEKKALELLNILGLSHRIGHKPAEMSGGEQQRVAIARALINSPAVILADEPSGNLDSVSREELHKLLFKLRDELGQTIIVVTHDLSLAEMVDRAVVMKDGEIIEA